VTGPKALLFDLDDTLLDWSGMAIAVQRTSDAVARRHVGLDAARLAEANASVWLTYWQEVEADWTLGLRESRAIQREAWRRALAACGVEDEEVAEYARETFAREELLTHRLYDDARRLLDGLGGRYPLALVTNGAADVQRDKLRVVDIETAFDVVVVSAEVGMAKPDCQVFGLALQALGVTAAEAWHVGDSLHNDVAGAKNAGIRAVWLNRTGAPQREDVVPDVEIATLVQLLEMLG
jgi:putative hydrolase of the HAD superfamily